MLPSFYSVATIHFYCLALLGGEGERGRGTAGQAAPPTGQDHQPHHAADQGTENVS